MPPASKKLTGYAGISLSVKSGLVKVYGMVKHPVCGKVFCIEAEIVFLHNFTGI